mgnify:CR=1 FL=1
MIRVRKSTDTPPSLQVENCHHYDGLDVQDLLYSDQYGKCYLCEQETHKAFQIEHFKPKEVGYFPELKYDWTNLFLSCGFCNGRKPNTSEILNPSNHNIEEIIAHRIDIYSKKAEFVSDAKDKSTNDTVELLNKLFNGKSNIRDVKGKILFDDLNREISNFLKMLLIYKSTPNEENRQIVIDLLHISKEFLGFKYWIIKDYGFFDDFNDFLVWNK